MDINFSPKAKRQLKKLGVAIVYLIGSRAIKRARLNSDFDFAVVMKNKKMIQQYNAKLHNSLYDIFSIAIPKIKIKIKLPYPENIVNIDIVFLQTAPLYYALAARNEGKVLFEISQEFRLNFEERITLEYADFEYFRREQKFATLAMI